MKLYVGDDHPDISGVLTFKGVNWQSLTGATVTMTMKDEQGNPKFTDRACQITIDDVAKTIDYICPLTAPDMSIAGEYTVHCTVNLVSPANRVSAPAQEKIEVIAL